MRKFMLVIFPNLLMLASCALADLRPETLKSQTEPTFEAESKGRDLLKKVADSYGLDKLVEKGSYQLILKDHFAGILGRFSNPWPVNKTLMQVRYIPMAFDSHVEVLEGKKKGLQFGMQGWKTWERKPGEDLKETNKDGLRFTLAAEQYFLELPLRLYHAPIVQYAGEETLDGEVFDVVFATWRQMQPHSDYDHYRVYR